MRTLLFTLALLLVPSFALASSTWLNRGIVVFDGDSLTKGNHDPPGADYPDELSYNYRPFPLFYDFTNNGVPSELLATMVTNASTAVDPLITAQTNRLFYYVVIEGGGNDVSGGDTASNIYGYFVTYANARVAASSQVTVLALTILPEGPISWTVAQNNEASAINVLLAANASAGAYTLVDLRNDARLTDPTNTTYFLASDQAHLTVAGNQALAQDVQTVLNLPGGH